MAMAYTEMEFINNCGTFGFFRSDYGIPFRMFTKCGFRNVKLIGFKKGDCVIATTGRNDEKILFADTESVMRSIRQYHDDLLCGAVYEENQNLSSYYKRVLERDDERLRRGGFIKTFLRFPDPYGLTARRKSGRESNPNRPVMFMMAGC